jgi:hypothetical protein
MNQSLVMIAFEANLAAIHDEVCAFNRVGPVANNIAEANDVFDPLTFNVSEDIRQGFNV